MITIIATNIQFFSQPLDKDFREGYEELVERVAKVITPKGMWTGFIPRDTILTTGWWEHGKEFDLHFKNGFMTSGFLAEDWDEIIEINFDYHHHEVPPMMALTKHPQPQAKLFSIGCFLGMPFALARCVVTRVMETKDHIMDSQRANEVDPCSAGSPIFDSGGALVGILVAYIPKTDTFVIRSLVANTDGKLIG